MILSPDPILPPHALEAERFGLTHAISGAGSSAAFRAYAPSVPSTDGGAEADDPMRVVLTSLDVNEAEKVLIQRALQVADNNRTRAAELLGISVRTLRNKLNNPGTA